MKHYYKVGIGVGLFFLWMMMGCGVKENRSPVDFFERFYQQMERISADSPEHVSRMVDRIIPSVKDSTMYYRLLLLKVRSCFLSFRLDSASYFLDKIGAFCDRQADSPEVARLYAMVYNARGNICVRTSQADSACQCYLKSFEYATRGGNRESLPDICLNLADVYVKKGRYDLGALWYNRSLSIADSLNMSDKQRFPAYYGLAQVNMELRDFAACDYYYNLASRYYDQMHPFEKHIYLNNRGNSYYYRQDYKTALKYFRRSLGVVNQYPDMNFERNLTMINLGEVFLLLNNLDSASYYLQKCRGFFDSIHHSIALYCIDTQLMELALKQGNVALAQERLKHAKEYDQVEPNMIHVRNRYLQRYYEKVGDYKQAYHYLKENHRMDDSIRNERVKMRAAEIELKYEQDSTLMKKEIFIREKENQLLQMHQWMYIIVGGCFLLIAVAFVIILYRKRLQEKEQWRMQSAISSLRLENVRNRISPHFVFNVLNREMNLHKGEAESKNLIGLTKLIRRNLELTDCLAVSLADELEFVDTYVDLEKESLGDDFHFQQELDERIDLQAVKVPSMLLQIPVENAIKHGLRLKEGKRLLIIKVSRLDDGQVDIVVCDNGGGYRPVSVNRGTGTGMKVITQTIQLLNAYNPRPILVKINNVVVGDENEMGCEVRFVVPLNYSFQFKKIRKA